MKKNKVKLPLGPLAAVGIIAILCAVFLAFKAPQFLQPTAPAENSAAAEQQPAALTDEPAAETQQPLPETLHIPILVYHRIGYSPKNADSVYKSLTIEPEWFEKHMAYLKDHGFETIKFTDVAAYFEKGTPLPLTPGAKPVMINFDDGYKGVSAYAWPIMKKYGMTGTVFAITNMVGHGAYMDWDQIKILQREGMEIGSHTVWHPNLTRSLKAKFEITESKKALAEKLETDVTAFSYPEGKYNDEIEQLVKDAGYKTARSYSESDQGISKENLFHMPVVKIYANVGLDRWEKRIDPPR